jgi:transposase
MPRVYILNLGAQVRESLEEIIQRGSDWRQRQRAQTLILLDDGFVTADVARLVGIHTRTVGNTRRDWFKAGLDCLVDAPRCGAPRKLSAEQLDKIVAAACAEPLSARELLAMHVADGGAPVHLNTIKARIKATGLVWKRTRTSLKKVETK